MSRVYAKPKEVKQNRSTITVETIPPELKALHQWVCWKYGEKRLPNGKRAKPLINPKTGQKASSTNPDTWHTYDQALSRFRIRKELHGIGFVFANNGYVGIDLDDCVQNGVLRPDARKMLTLLNSYTELSPSGTGLHIIVKGCKPDARCRPPKEIHNDTHSGGGGSRCTTAGGI